MFEGRLMKRFTGSVIAVFGLFYVLGVAGAIESGQFGVASVVMRMVIGCVAVAIGAVVSGGLE